MGRRNEIAVIAALVGNVGCGRVGFDQTLDAAAVAVDVAPAPCLPEMQIGVAEGRGMTPAIAAIGQQIGLAWSHERDLDGTFHTLLTRVAPDGSSAATELASAYAPGTGFPWIVDVAASPSVYGVAWADGDMAGASRLWFAIVDTDGVLRRGPVRVDSTFNGQPSVVWTGDVFALAYAANDSMPPSGTQPSFIRLMLFEEDGAARGGPFTISDADSRVQFPSLVWTGSGYLVAWRDSRTGSSIQHLGAADATGMKRGPDVAIAPTLSVAPSLAWTGSDGLLVYGDGAAGDLYLVKVDAVGNAQAPINTMQPWRDPSITWDGSLWRVAAREVGPPFRPLLGTIDTALTVSAPLLASERSAVENPGVAWIGDRVVATFATNDDYPQHPYLLELCP